MIHKALKAQGITGVVWHGHHPTSSSIITAAYLDEIDKGRPRMQGISSDDVDISQLKTDYAALLVKKNADDQKEKDDEDDEKSTKISREFRDLKNKSLDNDIDGMNDSELRRQVKILTKAVRILIRSANN